MTETLPANDSSALTADAIIARLTEAVSAAFRTFTANTQEQREDLYALTMSGLGGCTRQAAYRLARTKPSEDLVHGEMREANIGTMIHAGLLPILAKLLDGAEEIAVELRVGATTIKGRSDLYVPALRLVTDLKTISPYKLAVLGNDAAPAHRVQVAGYALAVRQRGEDVDWIAWIYLDRASGTEHLVVEPFTDDVATLVIDRCVELENYATDPENAPRDERGPGLSIVCDQCPWLRQCWGNDASPGVVGAQRILAQHNDGVAQALALYDEARGRAKEAKADQEFARAMFAGYTPGSYGEFEFRFSSGAETADKDAAIALLADAGIPIPTKTTEPRLVVRRTRSRPAGGQPNG